MLNKKAKEILRKLIEMNNKSYLVILESYYPHGDGECAKAARMGATEEIWKDIYKLYQRYSQFKYYVKEVKPQWKVINTTHFADNSIEETHQSKDGQIKTVMVKYPSGDICF